MGYLQDQTHQDYYQGNDYGNYQFTSLDDVINQFIVAYVGEDKIISRVKRVDVAFHAQRALQELSFDTFKSCKAQEITVAASLQMILPHDYVNYTKVSWVDSAGIKHLLYPTSKTSNPNRINQDENGEYQFPPTTNLLVNSDFVNPLVNPWFKSDVGPDGSADFNYGVGTIDAFFYNLGLGYMGGVDQIGIVGGALAFTQHREGRTNTTGVFNKSRIYYAFQKVNVSGLDTIDISATGTCPTPNLNVLGSTMRMGIIATAPDTSTTYYDDAFSSPQSLNVDPVWLTTQQGNDARLEWLHSETNVTKTLSGNDAVDVSSYSTVWLLITSFVDFDSPTGFSLGANSTSTIDNIVVIDAEPSSTLNLAESSTTWSNYKSHTPSESQDDYQDDTYWPMDGSRYGLDPQHAQANGSFYIDCVSGKIHFSSNVSGKTVVLDYISDSLGTDGEMQVHKFAEEAMYKWVAHAILSTRANVQPHVVNRFKKERFAAIRTAKLRLSNLKLEELTQILRGKSKQIKH